MPFILDYSTGALVVGGPAIMDAARRQEEFSRAVEATRINLQRQALDLQRTEQALRRSDHAYRNRLESLTERNRLRQLGGRPASEGAAPAGFVEYLGRDQRRWWVPSAYHEQQQADARILLQQRLQP